jgi:hypothetical protein
MPRWGVTVAKPAGAIRLYPQVTIEASFAACLSSERAEIVPWSDVGRALLRMSWSGLEGLGLSCRRSASGRCSQVLSGRVMSGHIPCLFCWTG